MKQPIPGKKTFLSLGGGVAFVVARFIGVDVVTDLDPETIKMIEYLVELVALGCIRLGITSTNGNATPAVSPPSIATGPSKP